MKVTVKGINLLPKEYIQAEQAKRIRIIVGALVFLEACLFVGAIAIPPKNKISNLEKEVEYVIEQTKADKFKDVNKTIAELEKAKKDVQEWVDKYGNIKKENIISARMLDSFTSRVPLGVSISSVQIIPMDEDSIKEDSIKVVIEMKVKADSIDSIHRYINVIESVYGRGSVVSGSSIDEKTGQYDGNLTISVPVDRELKSDETVESTQSNESSEGGDN